MSEYHSHNTPSQVACEWVRANEARWRPWLPVVCPPGWAADASLTACEPCRAGFYCRGGLAGAAVCPADSYCEVSLTWSSPM